VPADIGAPYEGGFYGGLIRSHDGAKTLAVVWAPKAQGETTGPWLPSAADVPDARSCVHSMDNTRAMADAGSPLAQWALAQQINGHADWCIPARDVLELGYRHLKPTTDKNWRGFRDGDNPSAIPSGYPYTDAMPAQTTVEAFRAGGAEAFSAEWYLASTQYSAGSAWLQNFYYGYQGYGLKTVEARVRLVRLIQLNP
jgi:hypothetical protein